MNCFKPLRFRQISLIYLSTILRELIKGYTLLGIQYRGYTLLGIQYRTQKVEARRVMIAVPGDSRETDDLRAYKPGGEQLGSVRGGT